MDRQTRDDVLSVAVAFVVVTSIGYILGASLPPLMVGETIGCVGVVAYGRWRRRHG